ncbi:uncharacterized protein [Heterodontus francisci]|uniref:uncharacterized protein n=1 Tax=Heterodontus francisci TaxID=7792 RepID=UPI00355AD724
MSRRANQDARQWPEETPIPQLSEDGALPEWFHGFASRREVEELLMDQPLGSFLLRMSESQGGLVLSYSGTDRCRHFIIEQLPEKQYRVLGDQLLHNSIPELLNYYHNTPILPFVEFLTTACNKAPEKHYEDIDRIRRRKSSVSEEGGGAAAGDEPDVPETGAGWPSMPGAPAFDPKTLQDTHLWAAAGAAEVTLDDATYQEAPDKHYEDIDRIRRRKPSLSEEGGGAAAGAVPDVPEADPGSTSLPGAPAFDSKALQDTHLWTVAGATKSTLDDATYQEILEARSLAKKASSENLSRCPPERGVDPAPSHESVTYAKVIKPKRHIYTEPRERPCTAMEEKHTYAEPAQARLYAEPDDGIAFYAVPQDLLPQASWRERHHVYSELDPKQTRPGNLYYPTPTKGPGATPNLPPRQLADPPCGVVVPTAPPRWPSPPLLPPNTQPIYAQPARRSLGLHVSPDAEGLQPCLAGDSLELDDVVYGDLPRPVPSRPQPAPRPVPSRPQPAPRPVPATPAPELSQDENLYERVPEEYLRPLPFAPTKAEKRKVL